MIFSLAELLLSPFMPLDALLVVLTLMVFALLEGFFEVCVGCIVYSQIVFLLFGARN